MINVTPILLILRSTLFTTVGCFEQQKEWGVYWGTNEVTIEVTTEVLIEGTIMMGIIRLEISLNKEVSGTIKTFRVDKKIPSHFIKLGIVNFLLHTNSELIVSWLR